MTVGEVRALLEQDRLEILSSEGTWHRVNPLSPFAVDLCKHQRTTLFRHIAPTYTIRETT